MILIWIYIGVANNFLKNHSKFHHFIVFNAVVGWRLFVRLHTHTHTYLERSTAAAGDVWFPSPANATSDGRGRRDQQHSWTLRCVFSLTFSAAGGFFTHPTGTLFLNGFFSMNVLFCYFFTKFESFFFKLKIYLFHHSEIDFLFFVFFRSCTHLNRVSRGCPVSHPVSFFFIYFSSLFVAWS